MTGGTGVVRVESHLPLPLPGEFLFWCFRHEMAEWAPRHQ